MKGRLAIGGFVVLAIAMGLGRFAYTPLLPTMQAQAGLTHLLAGILASSNLAGYLAGALAASFSALRHARVRVVHWSVVVVLLTTASMAIPSAPIWIVSRFGTGVASGFAFVLCSSLILDAAATLRAPRWPAIFYAGVGSGIALSGIVVTPLVAAGGWRWGWLGLALFFSFFAALALRWIAEVTGDVSPALSSRAAPEGRVVEGPRQSRPLFWWIFAAYGMLGVGYIIPATFLVAMFVHSPALASLASTIWIIVGLVAIPSTVFWNSLGRRIGKPAAFALALCVAGAGTAIPLLVPNAFGALAIAVALGATFMGGTLLANALARDLFPESSNVAIGRMTMIFGVGQIVGPLVATAFIERTGTYDGAMLFAACILIAGGLALATRIVTYRSTLGSS